MFDMGTVKARILLNHPFFGTLAMYLQGKEDDKTATAATDGEYIYYSQEFMDSLSIEEAQGVVLHEVLHAALGHIWRRGNRIPELWNIAADFAVNGIIKNSAKSCILPQGALYSAQFENLSAEEIYEKLPHISGGSGIGTTLDDHSMWGKQGAAESQETKAEWEKRLVAAAQIAKSQGNLPGAFEDVIDKIVNPQLPWKTILADFVSRVSSDWAWPPFDRRFVSSGLYLPARDDTGLADIVVAIDSSGSITEDEAAAFLAEVLSITSCKPATLHIIVADAEVQWHTKIDSGETLPKIPFKGRGGTSFIPAFEYVKKKGIEPAVFIYFTDGMGTFPAKAPWYPVLWVLTSDINVPFGRKARYDPYL